MLELFLSNKSDNRIILIKDNISYSLSDLKQIIASNIELLKSKKENIVILNKDNFSFVIKFFSSLFANKNVYLLSENSKLDSLNIDFDIFENISFEKIQNYDFKEIDIENPKINFFTSGSSAKPKTIQKSLYNLIEEAKDIGKEFNFKDKNYRILSTTNMCHLFGMTFHLMTSIVNGLIIDTDKISYPEDVDKDNAILISSPTFLNSVSKFDIPFKVCPKYIISAGSKLDSHVFKYLEKQSNIIEIYGSTESGVIAHKEHYNGDLTLFKNVKIKTDNDFITVKSNYLFGENAILNDKVELIGNTLKFKNRTDRMFKIYEKRVSAFEIENKLKENQFTEDCYILKSDDKLSCLCALSKEGKEYLIKNDVVSLTKELKNYLIKHFEIIPQKWKFIDEIPMNQSGKINKKLIEHIFSVNLSLPVILDRMLSKDSITYKVLFYSQSNFFNGHFPDFKLLAGVVQLYFAKEAVNVHFGLNLGQGQWKRIKFSNIIKPDDIVFLKLEKNEKYVSYEYFSNEKHYSSGIFLCENIFNKAL